MDPHSIRELIPGSWVHANYGVLEGAANRPDEAPSRDTSTATDGQ
ncbi:hypothetical protein ACT2FY_17120 [Paraburkholderia fungorum]